LQENTSLEFKGCAGEAEASKATKEDKPEMEEMPMSSFLPLVRYHHRIPEIGRQ
jgi:hypothetical protein